MRWEWEKIIRELKSLKRWDYQPKEDDVRKIRLFASKYFKNTWSQELSQFNYDIEQLREFQDFIDWESWYYWKGCSAPVYILYEFKDKCPKMQEDWEKCEKKYGVQYARDFKKK